MSAKTTTTEAKTWTTAELTAACRAAFGKHPVDIVGPIAWCTDALDEIGAILGALIVEATTGKRRPETIARLAKAAERIAFDIANTAGCEHEDFVLHLTEAGFTFAKEARP